MRPCCWLAPAGRACPGSALAIMDACDTHVSHMIISKWMGFAQVQLSIHGNNLLGDTQCWGCLRGHPFSLVMWLRGFSFLSGNRSKHTHAARKRRQRNLRDKWSHAVTNSAPSAPRGLETGGAGGQDVWHELSEAHGSAGKQKPVTWLALGQTWLQGASQALGRQSCPTTPGIPTGNQLGLARASLPAQLMEQLCHIFLKTWP